MSSELSILNAESYNDGTSTFRAPRSLPPRQHDDAGSSPGANMTPTTASMSTGGAASADEESRKRKPLRSASTESEEPDKKKRGRPKLDTNDETALDRRRTQIRLAQRAYRNRKESTIQSLEARVKELQDNNERMNIAFMELYNFAINCRIFESQPEFGRELQATTQVFVSLASRSASQDSARGEAGDSSAFARQPYQLGARTSHRPAGDGGGGPTCNTQSNGRDGRGSSDTNHIGGQRILYGGIVVTHEPEPEPEPEPGPEPQNSSASAAALHATTTTSSWSSPPPVSQPPAAPATGSSPTSAQAQAHAHTTATQASVRDASFPFGMSSALDSVTFTTTNTNTLLTRNPQAASLPLLAGIDPYATLPPPASFSHLERTFGRRLQRFALEQALRLLTLPDPPPTFYAAVFGFCLLFESRERITTRIANCLSVNQRENLCNWRFPFLHLGGAGTFFPELNNLDTVDLAASMRDAGAGIIDPVAGIDVPDDSSNDNVFTARTDCASDGLPLGNRGTVDLHRSHLGRDTLFGQGPWDPLVEETRDMRVDHKMRITTPGFEGNFYDCDEVEWYLRTRGIIISPGADKVTATIPLDAFPPVHHHDAQPEQNTNFDAVIDNSIDEWLTIKDGMAGDVSSRDSVGIPTPWTGSAGSGSGSAPKTPGSVFSSTVWGDAAFGSMAVDALGRPITPGPDKLTVTIDVAMLVQELAVRSVCLGRTPGIRPKDVNAAFWSAVVLQ
ncbi:hypothetical protein SODALDRAFT_327983 [Sodiomyces alkalinus F11]|uniref:BZIP domain-containing protein n=1 Tax=Sodiomyces alkalinus (strain CBS 110278 / VKM F-3762 / F11) TaxID=1314773 RepID=A0A3N2QAJ0_SODAK|nr:hypothetical protein SODALDRAFT_327983 [Sodiomyces alkalinus F11]ROT43769.1 hypothetical protein SODALDRAFT_327983 [Sodiomyces alkalinus F11]